jgi:hypothetical protein
MLPDYPQTKKLLFEMFRARIESAQNTQLGIFSEIPTSRLFEGRRTRLQRADGSLDEVEMERMEVSTNLSHDIRDFESLSLEKILDILDDFGRRLANERQKLLLALADRTTKEVGNVGSGTSPEGFLELFAKVQHDFDERGQVTGRQVFVASEDGKKQLDTIFRQIDENPSLKRRLDQIMANKRQEFRDREASRKLVD